MIEYLRNKQWGKFMGLGSWMGAIGVIIYFSLIIIIFLIKNDWSLKAMATVPWGTFGMVAGGFFTLSQVVISIMIGKKNTPQQNFPIQDQTSVFNGLGDK